jgi:uncharacterized protein (TIGR00290 family)
MGSTPGGRAPLALAWSGGKDSSLALAALRADPSIEIVALVTTVTRDYDRISMHGVHRSILEAQVAEIGIPLLEATIPAACSNEVYEQAFAGALETLRRRHPDLRRVAFGDLFLTDVRASREQLLARLGWEPVFPLWGQDTSRLARQFIEQGFRAILTCVDTTQLEADFTGREFDSSLLDDFPPSVDPCGEKGEFHTCVYAGPIFDRPLTLDRRERIRRDLRFEYCELALSSP